MKTALQNNFRIYFMEAVCLGLFMISASCFACLLESPASSVHTFISDDFVRLCLMAVAMGLTATAIIYSPMGKISGAHMNPAVSLTFMRLGKMKPTDGLYYGIFQIAGGLVAVYSMKLLLGSYFTNHPVNYVVTVPGESGMVAAFLVETVIAFAMMSMVLFTSNTKSLSNYTGIFTGLLVTSYIILTANISGFSMNPARTLASAIPAMRFDSLWIYLSAPFIGMLCAAEIFNLFKGKPVCAKLFHAGEYPCLFDCGYCNKHKSEMSL